MSNRKSRNEPPIVRCAIYTRKATDDRTNRGFNSIDAQRASAEAFVDSRRDNGWVCLSNRYDDCGFSGTNVDRPALNRLLADVHGGKIDCVIVCAVDRLSRSPLDFEKIIDMFRRQKVALISVTEQSTQQSGCHFPGLRKKGGER